MLSVSLSWHKLIITLISGRLGHAISLLTVRILVALGTGILLLLLIVALSVLLLLLVVVGGCRVLLLLVITLCILLLLLIVAGLRLLIVHVGGRQYLLNHHRLDVVFHHVRDQLLWNLLEDLLCQIAFLDGFVVDDELDDVTSAGLAIAVLESSTIAIKLLHHREVCVTHADDYDGDRMQGKFKDKILRLFHIMYGSICKDQQHVVSHLAAPTLHHSMEFFEQGCKVSRSCKLDLLQGLAVRLRDSFDGPN